jgi:hypothetical protein
MRVSPARPPTARICSIEAAFGFVGNADMFLAYDVEYPDYEPSDTVSRPRGAVNAHHFSRARQECPVVAEAARAQAWPLSADAQTSRRCAWPGACRVEFTNGDAPDVRQA